MTSLGTLIEVQGTAEGAPFRRADLDALLSLAEAGCQQIFDAQSALIAVPPTPKALGR
jgi:ribonuclease PH